MPVCMGEQYIGDTASETEVEAKAHIQGGGGTVDTWTRHWIHILRCWTHGGYGGANLSLTKVCSCN